MYHRVGKGKHANSLQVLTEHLTHLQQYPVVLPGEPLAQRKLSICLTFDDALFDFYHFVFPLLKRFKMRAIVGVPVRYILESTSLLPEERLAVPYGLAMQDGIFETQAPFCTWEELREMVASSYVQLASHSYMHCNLTFPFVDLAREVVFSKQLLEENVPQAISSFIYPFGRTNRSVHAYVRKHYPYCFRIGSAMNFDWNTKRPLTRVCADNRSLQELLSPTQQLKYLLKGFIEKFLR